MMRGHLSPCMEFDSPLEPNSEDLFWDRAFGAQHSGDRALAEFALLFSAGASRSEGRW